MDFVSSLKKHFPEELIDELIKSLDKDISHCLLLNPNKISDEEFIKEFPNVRKHPFIKHAYYYEKETYDFGKSYLYETGSISIQDASSMLVAHLLDVEKDDIILDLCASPGGKSIGVALQNPLGLVIANDISNPRAKALSSNIERMGLGNVVVTNNDFQDVYRNYLNYFDKIVLDAPCSGSAMFRKNDLAKADWSYEKVCSLAKKQGELLELCYQMLKEGGYVSYSTCSFSYEEDEGVILSFLDKQPDMEMIKIKDCSSFYHHPDLKEAIHLFPNLYEGEGQFIAILHKKGELRKEKSRIIENKKYKDFIEENKLENRSNEVMKDALYSLSRHFENKGLNILRYGVKCFEIRKDNLLIPDHNLSHYLDSSSSIALDEEKYKKYLNGESFAIEAKDGFRIVSYKNKNVGYIKVVNKIAKNHYPKGLRKKL